MTYRPTTNRYAVSLKVDYLDATAQRLQDVVSTQMKSRKSRTHRFFCRSVRALSHAIVVLMASFFVPGAIAESPFTTLEAAMSRDEQIQSGLDRLSPEQRAYLNEWLQQRFGRSHSPSTTEPGLTHRVAPVGQGTDHVLEAEIERRVALEVAAARADMEAQVAQAKAEIKADDEAEQKLEPFEARITGDFRGWNGSTVFTLDNGQVWRQRHGSSYRHTSSDTRVKFDTNWLGMWEMTVLSSGRTAVVKRLD